MLKPCLLLAWVWYPLHVAGDGATTTTSASAAIATTFEIVGSGFCMDSQGKYYDAFGACGDEVADFDGTVLSCKGRATKNAHAVGFDYSTADETGLGVACCKVLMENGFVPTEFTYVSFRSPTSNEGTGEIQRSSSHSSATCYRRTCSGPGCVTTSGCCAGFTLGLLHAGVAMTPILVASRFL